MHTNQLRSRVQVPATMAANQVYFYDNAGSLSTTLELRDCPIPQPQDGDIILKLVAAALNPVDEQIANSSEKLLTLMGMQVRPGKVPGCDFSGVVHAVGSGAKWAVGDEVCGVHLSPSGDGSMQKYLRLSADAAIARKPASLTHQQTAAFPLVYSTVHTAFVKWGKLSFPPVDGQEERSVLILGGSGGTGTFAVQLAKAMGLKVVTTCSSKNVELLKDLGADEVIDYKLQDVVTSALFSSYAPYAVVLDCVGGTEFIPHLDHLLLDDPNAPQLGIYVTIVGDKTHRDSMGGPITNILNPVQRLRTARGYLKDYIPRWAPLLNAVRGPRYACIMLEASEQQLDSIKEYTKRGGKIMIDSEWPFTDVKGAYARLESSRAVGKIVVNFK